MNLKRSPWIVACALTFVAGAAVGTFAAKIENRVPTALFSNGDGPETARSLLDVAVRQADGGSWERIGVARVHYLSGDRDAAEAIFAGLSGPDADPSDLIRIARVLTTADEWDRAKEFYERTVQLAPKDADWKVEFAAQLNVRGDRERAEALFREAFEKKPANLWNTLNAAGSYLGVPPQLEFD